MSDPIVMENDRLSTVHFQSVTDLLEYDPSGLREASQFTYFLNYEERNSGWFWFGGMNKTAQDVIRKSLLGDPDMYRDLKRKIAELDKATGTFTGKEYDQDIKKVKRKIEFGSFGDELDIHKVYRGDLEKAWRRTKRIESNIKHKLITLFIDTSGIGTVRAEATLWRAAVAVKLCRDLEAAGKSVKIIVGGASNGALMGVYKTFCGAITVKEYNQKLALERLAAMSHIGFYRTFIFASKFVQGKYKVSGGLGISLPSMNESVLPINLQEEIKKGHTKVICVQKMDSLAGAIWSINDAKDRLQKASTEKV